MSRTVGVTLRPARLGVCGAVAVFALSAALSAGPARAQSASGTLSSYRTGYGGAGLGGLESPVAPSLISSTSQFAISDGVNTSGAVGSVFNSQSSGGAGQSATGVGQTAAAASNERAAVTTVEPLTANATGAHDAATASKTQASSAGLPANATSSNETSSSELVLNGKVNLDGGQ